MWKRMGWVEDRNRSMYVRRMRAKLKRTYSTRRKPEGRGRRKWGTMRAMKNVRRYVPPNSKAAATALLCPFLFRRGFQEVEGAEEVVPGAAVCELV